MPAADLGSERRARLAAARLYLVCDANPGGRALPDLLRAAIAGGVEIVQLRDKLLADEELTAVANAARALCERLGALLIVNDRPLVAAEAGADGVHVGQDDMPVAQVREIVGPDMLIGLSTHAESEIDAASASGADGAPLVDYIGVGPVHETPTKPGRPAVGVELVRYAAAHAPVPFFAIGGLDADERRRGARRRRRRASSCCARSPTPTTPSAPRASCAGCSTAHPMLTPREPDAPARRRGERATGTRTAGRARTAADSAPRAERAPRGEREAQSARRRCAPLGADERPPRWSSRSSSASCWRSP